MRKILRATVLSLIWMLEAGAVTICNPSRPVQHQTLVSAPLGIESVADFPGSWLSSEGATSSASDGIHPEFPTDEIAFYVEELGLGTLPLL
jgi:hypothetical protein